MEFDKFASEFVDDRMKCPYLTEGSPCDNCINKIPNVMNRCKATPEGSNGINPFKAASDDSCSKHEEDLFDQGGLFPNDEPRVFKSELKTNNTF